MRPIFVICVAVLLNWNFATAEEKEIQPNVANVEYHVWYDPDPSSNDLIERINLQVEAQSKFIKVMDKAASQNQRFKYEYVEFPFGKYITSIGGFKEDVDKKIHWMIFELNESPSLENRPSDDQLSPVGVDELEVSDGKSYLFWRKRVEYNKN